MNLDDLRRELASAADRDLAGEILAAYDELRTRYYEGDYRPGVLEGGRFAEAAFRIVQIMTSGSYTALGKNLPKVPDMLKTFELADASKVHDSFRIHIPRALAAVYNVRNRRDIGHIGSDVDANGMDASYVMAACNWVLAELIRLLHNCSADEAQAYVEAIVERRAPLVEVFADEPFVLAPGLSARSEVLLLIYHQGSRGASLDELDKWCPVPRTQIRARLADLENDDRFIKRAGGRAYITRTGSAFVEAKIIRSN